MPLNKETLPLIIILCIHISKFVNDKKDMYILNFFPKFYQKARKIKLATFVEGDPKVPFSIATTQKCRGRRYFIPWITPLYTWPVPYNAKC